MRLRVSYRLFLAGVMGLGLCGFASAQPRTSARTEDRNIDKLLASGEDFEVADAFDRIPEPARRKIDELKGRDKLLATYRIHRSGKDFYRATLETRKAERVALVTSDGAVMNVEDIRPEEMSDYKAHTDAWYRDYDDRLIARQRHIVAESEIVTATVDHPEKISWDHCPAPVRNSLIRESAGEKVDYIIRYRDHNQVIYQTTLDDGPGKRHMVQIKPDGGIFNEGEYTKGGTYNGDEWKPRTIGFNDLPDNVRATVTRAVPHGRIPHVEVVKRRGHDFYTVTCESAQGDRYLTMNDAGVCVADVTDSFDVKRAR